MWSSGSIILEVSCDPLVIDFNTLECSVYAVKIELVM